MAVVVGLLVLELRVVGSGSLKDKRRVVCSLIDRVRARHNVAAAETEYQDLLQRAEIAFSAVAAAEAPLGRLFDQIVLEAEEIVPGTVTETAREFLG